MIILLKEKVTEKELAVLKVIAETMNMYQDGFSDVMLEDIAAETGFSKLTVRGLLGTLDQKDMIDYMDVNGEYNVYYVRGAAEELLDFDLSEC
jgi:DNA-binding IclR family transcriptional regulator